jgi:hypothetical protein
VKHNNACLLHHDHNYDQQLKINYSTFFEDIVHRYKNLTAGNLMFSFSLKVETHHAPADVELGDKFFGTSTGAHRVKQKNGTGYNQ